MPDNRRYPLTSVQEVIWLDQALSPDSPHYIIGARLEFEGELHIPVLEAALRSVVDRHDALRIVLEEDVGTVHQLILPSVEVKLPFVDLADREDAIEAAATHLQQEFMRPFELFGKLLWRSLIVRAGPTRHYWLLAAHHLITDGFGIALWIQAVSEAYGRLQVDTGASAKALAEPFSYLEFLREDRDYLASERFAKDREFWKDYLAFPPSLQLSRAAREADVPHRSEQVLWSLERPLFEQMAAIAARHELSLPHFIFALIGGHLARTHDCDDVLLGLPVHNRRGAREKQTLGLFASVIPLRLKIDRDASFLALMQSAAAQLKRSYRHQRLPISQIRRDAGLNPTGAALFDVVISFESFIREVPFGRITPHAVAMENGFTRTALSIYVRDYHAQADPIIEFCFDTTVFERAQILSLRAQLKIMAHAALADVRRPLQALEIIGPLERRRILEELDAPQAGAWPLTRRIDMLICAQAREHPEAVALRFENETCTYGELDARANRLAHRLTALGVRREGLVGIAMERSVDAMIAIVAILKAGGAYVPLDPRYPRARLEFMMQDAQLSLLVTHSALVPQLPATAVPTLCLDTERAVLAAQSSAALEQSGSPNDLAYIIYTSGSSGRPKGVAVEHTGVCNFVHWQRQALGVGVGQRILQFASLSFDASVWEIFMALCNGATLVLGHQETLSGPDLEEYLLEQQVTHATLPPIVLSLLSERRLRQLTTVISAGDACPVQLAHSWSRGRRFLNGYGPTENTVCASLYACTGHERDSLPVGRPIPNVYMRILDANLNPVPIGTPGEVHLGGVALARGYLNQPGLTAAKFIADPFAPGRRLYKTGDRGRYRADGNVEFLGRIDAQVKLRGFRIEPGEIESVLSEQPQVGAAAVALREDAHGIKRLIAYVVPKVNSVLDTEALRDGLSAKLPEYMVPNYFVSLDRLPLTPNGKIDRKALPPAPVEAAAGGASSARIAPRTAGEETLTHIWKTLLRHPQLGIHDNFFELGGDSILAIQVVARAREAGMSLSPRELFDHPTIAQLAAVASTASRAIEADIPAGTAAPLLPIQRWFFAHDLPNIHHWNQSVLLVPSGSASVSHIQEAWRQIARHHDAFRLRFTRGPGGWMQHYGPAVEAAAFDTFDLTQTPHGEESAAVTRTVAVLQGTLDIENGPLVRAAFFDFGTKRPGYIALLAHHLIVDGVSWRILLGDLELACAQLARGDNVRLPPKTTSAKAFAELLEQRAHSPQAEQAARYWVEGAGLQSAPTVAFSPFAPVSGENLESSSESVHATLSPQETGDWLQRACNAYRMQADEILIAALALTLARHTGSSRVAVRLEGHGREALEKEVDLSRTVGWFTSVFPVCLDLGDTADTRDVLRSVKDQLRAIPWKGLAYGLVRELAYPGELARALRALPEPQVTFNYLGHLDRGLSDTSPVHLARESCPAQRAGANPRVSLIDIEAHVLDSRLQLRCIYSRHLHEAAPLARFLESYVATLRELIAHCLSSAAGGHTPSDFELAGLSQAELDDVLDDLKEIP